ncbi:MAG: hypothetical protein LLG44_11705, partial [Chloroflexi bacterium]|nr:hypothetical protein [Chloroflexota bacterium]
LSRPALNRTLAAVRRKTPMPDELDLLLEHVSAAARVLPGAVELHLFGSAANPATRDGWSDLDLQVVSEYPALSQAAWPDILGLAGTLELIYPLTDNPHASACSIAFAGTSPYHKVDIGLSAQDAALPFGSDEPHILLWRQNARLAPVPYPPHSAYQPEVGTAAHFLVGQLLGAVRYLKARQRGQQLACWRYLSAALNGVLICVRWEGDPLRFNAAPLSSREHGKLDQRLAAAEREGLFTMLDLRTPAAMDRAFLVLVRRISACICPDYAASEAQLARLVREYLAFMAEELALAP